MSGQQWEKVFYTLALCAALAVLLFSIYNQYSVLMIVIRTIIGFSIIYLLGIAFVHIWQILAKSANNNKKENNIDFLLGAINSRNEEEQKEINFPGQINTGLRDGWPDKDSQAEISKKLGLE